MKRHQRQFPAAENQSFLRCYCCSLAYVRAMLRRTCAGVSALSWPSTTLCVPSWHKPRRQLFKQDKAILVGIAARRSMAANGAAQHAAGEQQQLMELLADAHAHPQLDPANMQRVQQLQCCHVAAMSVSYDVDWNIMLQLHQLAGSKILPGFGIHPWWSHLHASSKGDTWQQLLEAPSQEQLQQAIDILAQHDPVTNSGAYATNRPESPPAGSSRESSVQSSSSSEADSSERTDPAVAEAPAGASGAFAGISSTQDADQQQQQQGQQQGQQPYLGSGLRVVPQQEWEGRLRQLLQQMPHAFVGEIGLDRAACIPGSKAKTSLQHQLELVKQQVAIAAEYQRPVSMHCVRGYGHLLQLFSELSCQPNSSPPKVMLHSYGGSVEEIPRFCKLKGIGDRFYFSFSHAINARTPEKLAARIAAVPDDRLLIESDQVTPLVIDGSLLEICQVVAAVKGWGLQETAQRMLDNFKAFYAGQLSNLQDN